MNRRIAQPALAWILVFGLGTAAGLAGGFALAGKARENPAEQFQGRTQAEAADGLLTLAEERAGDGSWERIAVGRAWYLGGDRERGRAIFDAVTSGKPEGSDLFRIARVYLEADEPERAFEAFERALEMEPKDDSGMIEAGAWHNLHGDREAAEALFVRAFERSPKSFWHAVTAGGSYLGVPPR